MVKLNVEQLIEKFKLQPLAVEGGFFCRNEDIDSQEFSNIYFLITENSFSSLHKLKCNEIWNFIGGDSVNQLQLKESGEYKIENLGPIVEENKQMSVVEKNIWQATKLNNGGKWALFNITVVPSFKPTDFEIADDSMIEKFSNCKELDSYLPRNNK